jgi:hypothetical protein
MEVILTKLLHPRRNLATAGEIGQRRWDSERWGLAASCGSHTCGTKPKRLD